MTIPFGLAVTAALLHGAAYYIYNRDALKSVTDPNAAAWSVWAFAAGLNAFSFAEISGWVDSLQFFTGTVAALITFCVVWFIGQFEKLTKGQWRSLVLGVAAALVWWYFKSAEGAQVILIISVLIGLKPFLEGVVEDPTKERPLAWVLWTLAFACTVANVTLQDIFVWQGMGDFQDKRFFSYLMPVVLLFAHALIAWLTRDARVQRYRETQKTATRKDGIAMTSTDGQKERNSSLRTIKIVTLFAFPAGLIFFRWWTVVLFLLSGFIISTLLSPLVAFKALPFLVLIGEYLFLVLMLSIGLKWTSGSFIGER